MHKRSMIKILIGGAGMEEGSEEVPDKMHEQGRGVPIKLFCRGWG